MDHKMLSRITGFLAELWNRNHKEEWKGSWPKWRAGEWKYIDQWIDGRKAEEGAEGLWRIHDKLYDLNAWADIHPGGKYWITATKGTDITESFETHHLKSDAEKMLPKFYIRDAKKERNSPFTFKKDGFYSVLRGKVKEKMKNIPNKSLRSDLFTDSLFVTSLLLAVLAAKWHSAFIAVLSGIVLCCLTICAHNYFHRRDNFRMHYFDLSLLSHKQWRISHAISHHLFANTRYDLEITIFIPFFQWFPKENKTIITKYVSWVYTPIVYLVILHKQWFDRLWKAPEGWSEFKVALFPLTMWLLGGCTFLEVLGLWTIIILSSSFTFGVIGVNAAHHHPDIFHDGDLAREDNDWGLHQLDAVKERKDIRGNHSLVMVTFGDHTMHHLFPTLDHALLDQFYPILEETCKEFGYHFTYTTAFDLVIGQFKQLARTQPKTTLGGEFHSKTE